MRSTSRLANPMEVVATLEEIKQAGYKISLTMEATIRFENGSDEGNGEAVSLLELPSKE
jgi:hypothetical protein